MLTVGPGRENAHTTLPKDTKSRTLPQEQNKFGRGSIRRSLTFPRNMIIRRNGETPAPASSSSNFVRNIFLTFVRPRTKPKQSLQEEEDSAQPLGELLPAAVGLKNQGNTCYMNSIVQCLSHTDALAKFLVTDSYKRHLRKKIWTKKGGEVTEEFASILKNAWLRLNSDECAAKFKTAVDRGSPQWRGNEEHDACEFLLFLLDKLHEDLIQATSRGKQSKRRNGGTEEETAAEAVEDWRSSNYSVIQEIFGASFRSSLTCPVCRRESLKFEPFFSVSLPIPEMPEELPIYAKVMFLSQQPRLVKLGLTLPSTGEMKDLTESLKTDTGNKEILLLEIDGEGFHRTFSDANVPLTAVSKNEALYALEMPTPSAESIVVLWVNVLVMTETTRVRFGSPYVSQFSRETAYVDLQKLLLKEMATILRPGVLVSEQRAGVFRIRIVDGTAQGSLVDPSVPHPLFTEAIDDALGLCTGGIFPHVKILLEWTPSDKEEIIADESELVEEHLSYGETREKSQRQVSVDLKECFDLYTTAEELRGDNAYHCPHCKRKEEGSLKTIGLWSAPQILVLHLKRFRHTQGTKGRGSSKISTLVDFPLESLDLSPHVSKRTRPDSHPSAEQVKKNNNSFGGWRQRASFKKSLPPPQPKNGFHHDDDNLNYDLFAVCNHHGKDLQGGHYTAYCRNPVENSWFHFDDTRVREVPSTEEIKTSTAYILFYQRRPRTDEQQGQWVRNLIRKHHKYQRNDTTRLSHSPKQNHVHSEINQNPPRDQEILA